MVASSRGSRRFGEWREKMSGMRSHRIAPVALLLVFAWVAAACAGNGSTGSPAGSVGSTTFAAQLAGVDVWAGAPQRVEIGIEQSTQATGVRLVTFGTVQFAFSYLGTDGSAPPTPGPRVIATYLPAPTTKTDGAGPALSDPSTARGVYQAENVTFDHPGIWQADVTADVQGTVTQHLSTQFAVAAKPAFPAPGQKALHTENLTLASKHVPASAIDSRAQNGAPVPDPDLHRWTIAGALAEHRPILVVFATPVYCTSQFCGPTVDGVEALAKQYANRAVFIHVEIVKKVTSAGQVPNQAAVDWLFRNGDLIEPWLYLIGSDGVIKDRWAPLYDPSEVAKELAALPPMKG
jgi:hypothetical protein